MAKFWLINTVVLGTIRMLPGDSVDDTIEDAGAIRSGGGTLWPQGNPIIDAAAAEAFNARFRRGANEVELQNIMEAAVNQVQLSGGRGPGVVAHGAALTALNTTDINEGDGVYVQTYRQRFKLRNAALTLRADEVLASSDPNKVWVRDLGPSEWTYQFAYFYNKDSGTNTGDGSETSPVQQLDEFWRRIRVWSGGTNGVQQQYVFNLQTDANPVDTFFPSGTFQSDGVQVGRTTGDVLFNPTVVGYRRVAAVTGGSGALTAAATLENQNNRTKATMVDAGGQFAALVGRTVMVADTATAASGTGTAASISAASGIVTVTGGTGFVTGSVNRMFIVTGAANSLNNGAFPITKYISSTSIQYHNPNAPNGADANNGAISWTEKATKQSKIGSCPSFTNGTGVTVSAVNCGFATLVGFPANTIQPSDVGMLVNFSGGVGGNTGNFTIVTRISDTSCTIANKNAVVDATVMNFQGVVEVGPTWYDEATLLKTAAAPSSGSPYVVVTKPDVPQRMWGLGKPAGLVFSFVDCQLSTSIGLGSGDEIIPVNCDITNGGLLPGGAGSNVQSICRPTLSCYKNPAAGFGTLIIQENGYFRPIDTLFVGYNVRFREPGTLLVFMQSMIQGGYLGPAGEEAGSRQGSAFGWTAGQPRGLAVFNNVAGSTTNPAAGTNSAGAAIVLARCAKGLTAKSATAGQGTVWGLGALIGMHTKEQSLYMSGPSVTPALSDMAGHAGYPVNEVKFGTTANAPIPVPSTTTGVPAAPATTSGTAATFTASNGIITVVDAGATFTNPGTQGRTLTFVGQNNPLNNGTFPVVMYLSPTSVQIRNPVGVTDAVAAGSWTENPVVTTWAQLFAAPYSGNACNYVDGSAIRRVAET